MILLPDCKCCGGGGCDCCPNLESVSVSISVSGGSGEGFSYECVPDNPKYFDPLQGGPVSYESTAFEWSPTLADYCSDANLQLHDPESGELTYYGYGIQLCPLITSVAVGIGGNVYTTSVACHDGDTSHGLELLPSVFNEEAVFVRATQELFSPYWFGAGGWQQQHVIETPGWSVTLVQTRDVIKMQRLWQRDDPQITLVYPSSTGKDAAFTPVFKKYTDGAGQPMWQLESVTVDDGGSGYDPTEKNFTHADTRVFLSATNLVGGFPQLTPVFSAESSPASITGVTLTAAPGDWPNGNLFVGKQGYLDAYSRSEPTITATAPGGVTLSVTLQKHGSGAAKNTRQPSAYSDYTFGEYWEVDSIAITDAGSGPYNYPAAVKFDAHGAKIATAAQAYISSTTEYSPPPSVTVTPPASGAGATLGYTLAKIDAGAPPYYSSHPFWHISAISVTSGGDGYSNGDAVAISVPSGYEYAAASAVVVVVPARTQPDLTPYVWGFDGTTAGTGAVLSATMASNGDNPETWKVASIAITSGGSGYQVGEYIWYSELDALVASNPPYYVEEIDGWWITSVSGSGAITGLGVDPGIGSFGKFYKQPQATGPIQSVEVVSPGTYFKATEEPGSVTIQTKGKYYNETYTHTSDPLAEVNCSGEGWEDHEIELRLELRSNPDNQTNCKGEDGGLLYIMHDNLEPGGSYGVIPFHEPCVGHHETKSDRSDFSRSVQDMKVEFTFG